MTKPTWYDWEKWWRRRSYLITLAAGLLLAVAFYSPHDASAQQPTPPQPMPPLPASPLKLIPEKLSAESGRITIIRVETTAKKITWDIPSGFDTDSNDGGKKLVIVAIPTLPSGTYVLKALAAIADDVVVSRCEITITGAPSPPIPPQPADPLVSDLQRLYTADTNVNKSAILIKLAAIWRAGVGAAKNPNIATPSALLASLTSAVGSQMAATDLGTIRDRIGVELNKIIPADPESQMTADFRQRAADTFARIATALETIK